MTPGEIVAIALIALVIVGAIVYIVKSKKSGKKCIGCPFADSCGAKKGSCGGCEGVKTIADEEQTDENTK